MALLNQDREGFEFRFGRKPKVRSIKDIHDIWIKLKQRDYPRQKEHFDIWDKIYNDDSLSKDRLGKKIVYATTEKELRKMKFGLSSNGDRTYSYDVITDKKDKESDREEKLNFLLTNERSIELGNKFLKTRKCLGSYHHRIKVIFVKKVCDYLRDKYKNKKPDTIAIIKVGDYKYYFKLKDSYSCYLEFEFLGEVNDNLIEIF
jgi:hypothetical protein